MVLIIKIYYKLKYAIVEFSMKISECAICNRFLLFYF